MTLPPWASGPGEILRHGLSLLREDSDINRRLAMILIDNAVELMAKTYLGLPRRVTGINLSRRKYLEISESFTRLLDALEQHAADRLDGIDLGEIEWYHRVRNELYHQGSGLTVERNKVEVYAELAKLLFKNLFDSELQLEEDEVIDILGAFMAAWVRLERAVTSLTTESGILGTTRRPISPLRAVQELANLGVIEYGGALEIERLIRLRNQVVHGEVDYRTVLSPEEVSKIEATTQAIEETLRAHEQG